MIRQADFTEISDGIRYTSNDMAKLGCEECKGCSACCRNMEDTIVLDPYDIYNLTSGLSCSFEELLKDAVSLNITDGIILPHLKTNLTNDSCGFLDDNGRCRIHSFRPGICRLFPLGRIYEEGSFHYFLQANECLKENRTKVKIKKWIGYPDFTKYETFINDWHYLLKDLSTELSSYRDAEQVRTIQMMLLKLFFVNPYDKTRDFYEQFYGRMAKIH